MLVLLTPPCVRKQGVIRMSNMLPRPIEPLYKELRRYCSERADKLFKQENTTDLDYGRFMVYTEIEQWLTENCYQRSEGVQ